VWALDKAVEQCVAGKWMSDIVEAIHSTAEEYGVFPVRNYGGHGIGKKVHQEPFVPNNRKDMGKTNLKLRQGLVIAIEPMFALGTEETKNASDGCGYQKRSHCVDGDLRWVRRKSRSNQRKRV